MSRPNLARSLLSMLAVQGLAAGSGLGMALAASVILAVLTVTVMGLVERLRVGAVGTF